MKRTIKRLILGEGRKGRRVPFGLYRGLVLSLDPAVDSSFYFGLYERETFAWLRGAIRQAHSFVDVGTGCGELVVWALAHAHIQRVLAYDPAPHRWDIFRDNLRLNGCNLDPRLLACEDWFLGTNRAEEDVKQLCELPEPILFKIDVDGGEETILRTLSTTVGHKRCLFLIETHSRELDVACGNVLVDVGYSTNQIPQAWWRRFYPENRPLEFNQWLTAEHGAIERGK